MSIWLKLLSHVTCDQKETRSITRLQAGESRELGQQIYDHVHVFLKLICRAELFILQLQNVKRLVLSPCSIHQTSDCPDE